MKRILLPALLLLCVAASGQNPYLPLWEHLPDGEPRVFEDPDAPGKYRAYIIGSHDITYTAYCGNDIRIWSAPVEDLSQWRDEGPVRPARHRLLQGGIAAGAAGRPEHQHPLRRA